MKYGLVEIDWGYVGAQLAHMSDVEQTAFFKAFVKECGTWGTTYQVQSQLLFVNLKLTDEEKDVLSMLVYKEGK